MVVLEILFIKKAIPEQLLYPLYSDKFFKEIFYIKLNYLKEKCSNTAHN